ncbi:hypothetical protein SDC9_147229 [bioreactor metagenome]|uniref:Uncharacterized protein n=1 Tax=bioreactor metagenome TaxID=1076179 RepID=A0A645EDC0_9ZZZZ
MGCRLVERLIPVKPKAATPLIAKKHIFCNRKLRHQSKFLMDNDDTDLFAVPHIFKVTLFTVIKNFALIVPKRKRTA